MIFGRLSFPGTSRKVVLLHMVTVHDPKKVHDQIIWEPPLH